MFNIRNISHVTVAYKRKCVELMNKGLDEKETGEGKRAETL